MQFETFAGRLAGAITEPDVADGDTALAYLAVLQCVAPDTRTGWPVFSAAVLLTKRLARRAAAHGKRLDDEELTSELSERLDEVVQRLSEGRCTIDAHSRDLRWLMASVTAIRRMPNFLNTDVGWLDLSSDEEVLHEAVDCALALGRRIAPGWRDDDLIEALQHVSDAAADDWVNDTLSTERWVRHAFGHRSDTAARQAFPGRLLATLAEEADLAEAG